MKRLIAMVLTICMVLSLAPAVSVEASAAGTGPVYANGNYYETIYDALQANSGSLTVYLDGDTTENRRISISGRSVTILARGGDRTVHLVGSSNGYEGPGLFEVCDYGELTLGSSSASDYKLILDGGAQWINGPAWVDPDQ